MFTLFLQEAQAEPEVPVVQVALVLPVAPTVLVVPAVFVAKGNPVGVYMYPLPPNAFEAILEVWQEPEELAGWERQDLSIQSRLRARKARQALMAPQNRRVLPELQVSICVELWVVSEVEYFLFLLISRSERSVPLFRRAGQIPGGRRPFFLYA